MAAIIRTIFGKEGNCARLWPEVAKSLAQPWARNDAYHYVVGKHHADFLTKCGAKRVVLVDEADSICPRNFGFLWMKAYLIHLAVLEHKEVLFLDFDAWCERTPDNEMWDILRSKKSLCDGQLQMMSCFYRRQHYGDWADRAGWPSRRWWLNTCCFYCSNQRWTQQWLQAYIELEEAGLGHLYDSNDEGAMHYMIGRHFGIMPYQEVVNNFEMLVARLTARPTIESKQLNKTSYFWHK